MSALISIGTAQDGLSGGRVAADAPGRIMERGVKNVSIRKTQGPDRRIAGPGGRGAASGSRSRDCRYPAPDRRIRADRAGSRLCRARAPRPSAQKAPLPPKYRDPKTGATWSGRGKPPNWIVGKNRDRFLMGDRQPKRKEPHRRCGSLVLRAGFRRDFHRLFRADFGVTRPPRGAMPAVGRWRKAIRKFRRSAAPSPWR